MRTALILSASVLMLAACSKPEPPAEPVRAVRTMVVAADGAQVVHEYAGEVRARTESRLSFRVGGKLLKRHVDLGQHVKAGQLIAELDPRDLQLGEAASQAAVRSAQVNLELAQADVRRYQELAAQGFISGAELQRREVTLKAAQAQLDQARAQSGVQGNQAAYTVLRAEAAGVITAVEAEPGAVLTAGTTVVRLAHDGPRDIVFSVPEQRVATLRAHASRPGALTATLWGAPSAAKPARLRDLAAAADPATRTFLAKAEVADPAMRLGQTATVRLAEPAVRGLPRVPLSAVFEHQGRTSLWVLDPATMTVSPRPIAVGGAQGNEVVVAGGVDPGATVVTAGVHVLTPGQKVTRWVDPAAAAAGATVPAAVPPPQPGTAAAATLPAAR